MLLQAAMDGGMHQYHQTDCDEDPSRLSEFKTTTIHEVNNDSLADAP